jgi:DMSO/TMAO reductase YedYZ molybdopterin-dependent catalytic subunit
MEYHQDHLPKQGMSRRLFFASVAGSAVAVGLKSPQIAAAMAGMASISTTGADPGTSSTPLITQLADLYLPTREAPPPIAAEGWSLLVDGLVDTPMAFSLGQLQALPVYEDMRAICCVNNPPGGPLAANLYWRGVLLADVLRWVAPKTEATHVRLESWGGQATSMDIDWVRQHQTLLTYALNGQPLPPEHGFPLRIHIPGLYDHQMPRWLTRITFINQQQKGYWERHGLPAAGDVNPWVGILAAAANPQGQMNIQGVALAGRNVLESVEVQIDGGTWMKAHMAPTVSPLAWVSWHLNWQGTAPGYYQVAARALANHGHGEIHQAAVKVL